MKVRTLTIGLALGAVLSPPALGTLSAEGERIVYRQEYSKKQKKKMGELAQKPEVQRDIDGEWQDIRRKEIEKAYQVNTGGGLYNNPIVAGYVNSLGQDLVPEDSPSLYAFRLLYDPQPRAESLSNGTIYVSTGLVSLLDNEAQLAYVLSHEIAHVERSHHYEAVRSSVLEEKLAEEEQRSKSKKKAIFGIVGAVAGAAIGARHDAAGAGAALGGLAGYAVGGLTGGPQVQVTDWNTVHEDEADQVGVDLMLAQRYDPREVPKTYARLNQLVGEDQRIGLAFMGDKTRVQERTAHIQKLLAGPLAERVQIALDGEGLMGGTPDFAVMMSALKRDNGVRALYYDMFAMATANLQEAASLRSNDPRVHYYLGLVTSLTARTEEEQQAASNHFLSAVRYDAARGTQPEPYLHHALHLIKQNDPAYQQEATEALKNYVMLYQRQNAGGLPSNMYVIYDYFLMAGEASWYVPPYQYVSTEHVVNLGPDPKKAASLK